VGGWVGWATEVKVGGREEVLPLQSGASESTLLILLRRPVRSIRVVRQCSSTNLASWLVASEHQLSSSQAYQGVCEG
jgi:hypothetical protein